MKLRTATDALAFVLALSTLTACDLQPGAAVPHTVVHDIDDEGTSAARDYGDRAFALRGSEADRARVEGAADPQGAFLYLQAEVAGTDGIRDLWADAAEDLRGEAADRQRVANAINAEAEFFALRADVWADRAYALRENAADYVQVREAPNPAVVFHSIDVQLSTAQRVRDSWVEAAADLGGQEAADRIADAIVPADAYIALSAHVWGEAAERDTGGYVEAYRVVSEARDPEGQYYSLLSSVLPSDERRAFYAEAAYQLDNDRADRRAVLDSGNPIAGFLRVRALHYADLGFQLREQESDVSGILNSRRPAIDYLLRRADTLATRGLHDAWADKALALRDRQSDHDRVQDADDAAEAYAAVEANVHADAAYQLRANQADHALVGQAEDPEATFLVLRAHTASTVGISRLWASAAFELRESQADHDRVLAADDAAAEFFRVRAEVR